MKKLEVVLAFGLTLGLGLLVGSSPTQATPAPTQAAAVCPAGVTTAPAAPAPFLFQSVVIAQECQVLVQIYPDGTASECYCNFGTKCTPPEGIRHCNPDECVIGG